MRSKDFEDLVDMLTNMRNDFPYYFDARRWAYAIIEDCPDDCKDIKEYAKEKFVEIDSLTDKQREIAGNLLRTESVKLTYKRIMEASKDPESKIMGEYNHMVYLYSPTLKDIKDTFPCLTLIDRPMPEVYESDSCNNCKYSISVSPNKVLCGFDCEGKHKDMPEPILKLLLRMNWESPLSKKCPEDVLLADWLGLKFSDDPFEYRYIGESYRARNSDYIQICKEYKNI